MIGELILCVLVGSWMFCVAMLFFFLLAKMLGYEGVGGGGVIVAFVIACLFVFFISMPGSVLEDGKGSKYGIPEPYYTYDGIREERSLEDLERVLKEIEMPRKYKKHIFDCTEMSAYVEWYLENRGYNATLVGTDRHAQVVVYDVSGRAYVIGCTLNPPRVMGYKADFTYKNEWQDIYSASAYNKREWDWWEVVEDEYSAFDRRGAGTNQVNVGCSR